MGAEPRENPRTRRVREQILSTSVDVLLECGAHDVTAAIVAQRADVARTTIYRHWPDQKALLLATVAELTTPHHPAPPEGPLASDVRAELERLRERCVLREIRKVFGALAGYAAQHNEFREAQQLFVTELTQPMANALRAAIVRGELPAECNFEREARLLVSPILHWHLALGEDIGDDLLDDVADRWLAGL